MNPLAVASIILVVVSVFLLIQTLRCMKLSDKLSTAKHSLEEKSGELVQLQASNHELLQQRSHWERNRDLFQQIIIPQGLVMQRLQELALRFDAACKEQERARRGATVLWSGMDSDLKVAVAKDEFNKARDVARGMFYSVPEHLADYLKK